METLVFLGVLTGFLSGFFGIGGGTVLVPMLLLSGFDIKSAIAISIMQMVFSSIYGSYLNAKKNQKLLKDGLLIGLGGFLGGLFSGFIVSNVDGQYLKYLFLVVILFSIYRVYFSSIEEKTDKKTNNIFLLIVIGFFIGMIAISIGIGGSIILVPILVGYMYYNLKDAASLGLFFVIFSSIAGFISLSLSGHMHYLEGTIVGIFSLVGVYFGIKVKNAIHIKSYKSLTLGLYSIVLVAILYKL
ncbi:MAG: sulfite exporter TauE/SafE family protein [Campylobacterota bacterium]|nr:sulfite exporter TauE/SafE family protein [Campylobacterota bacterium]